MEQDELFHGSTWFLLKAEGLSTSRNLSLRICLHMRMIRLLCVCVYNIMESHRAE